MDEGTPRSIFAGITVGLALSMRCQESLSARGMSSQRIFAGCASISLKTELMVAPQAASALPSVTERQFSA